MEIYKPHDYQSFSTKHVIDNPQAALFLEMGLGKTVITLTALYELMYRMMEIEKVLVIAPKRVTELVWTEEQEKWEHLKALKISVVSGSEKQRIAALKNPADIYCVSRDNIVWLITYYKTKFPFDMIVVDELSSFKSPKARRFRALKLVTPMAKRVIGLTGTPAPNGLIDLWSQMYLIDQGKRLGQTVTGYRKKYFSPEKVY